MSETVTVKTTNGKTHKIKFTDNTTVNQLKQEVAKMEGINPEEVVLVYSGKPLEKGDQTLESAGIEAYATVFLVYRLRGGK